MDTISHHDRHLDDGRLLAIDSPDAGSGRGFAIELQMCMAPRCPCTRVGVRLTRLDQEGRALRDDDDDDDVAAELDLATGDVRVVLDRTGVLAGPADEAYCAFEGDDGGGTIASAILLQLPAGSGDIYSGVLARHDVIGGDFEIELQALVVGKHDFGDWAAGPIFLQ